MVSVQQPPDLRTLLQIKEAQLRTSLDEVRAKFGQAGDRGSGVETAVREFLRLHLPRRYDVGEGEVIDTLGNRSTQTDVVISDEQQPFSSTEDDPSLFIVEGVAAAGEVKSVLTTAELADTLAKAHRFKGLQKYSDAGSLTFSAVNPAEDRYFVRPPYFAIALVNQVAVETILDRLAADDRDRGDNPIGLDALFVLGQGFAANLGEGTDTLNVRLEDGRRVNGWAWTDSEMVLGDLLFWLAASTRRTISFINPIVNYLGVFMADRNFRLP